ncbi:MAG: NAD(P)-dependent alcohol dehydrogenase [Ignavibacteriota bacterium]
MKIERLQMEGPREDEVLVRIVASGVCHTDIGMHQGGSSDPVVLGHEGAGIVERVGKAISGVRPGDHVVLSYQSCGRCRACKSGRPTQCEHFWNLNFGFSRLDGSNALEASGVRGHFFGQSSFATHALATERNIVKVPKALPMEMLAPLGCGLQTGAATVMNSLAVRAGSSIAIFGTGAVGLAALMAARIVGCGRIIAVDIRPKRLQLAKELGATHLIDARRCDPGERIATLAGGVDYAVETTGDPFIERAAVSLLNPGGRLALLAGDASSEKLPEGRRVLSVIQGDAIPQQFVPRMIRLWRQGRFPFDRLLRFYDFRQINRAIADSVRGAAIKPVLRIPGS